MDTMNFLVWMLPVIFMLHDFEEIMMVEVWGRRYKRQIDAAWPKRQPFGLDYIRFYQTPTFSMGVEFEFILFICISFLSVAFQSYFIWYGAFLGVAVHMVFVHMLICVKFKHYVPGVTTSIILILPSVYVLWRAAAISRMNATTVLLALLLGVALLAVIIPFLHKQMGKWSEKLNQYANRPGEKEV